MLRRNQSSGPSSDQQFHVAVEDGTTNNFRKLMSSDWIRALPICRLSISDLRAFIARAESRVPLGTKTIAPCREWFKRILRSKSCIWALSDSFVDMLVSLRSLTLCKICSIAHIEISAWSWTLNRNDLSNSICGSSDLFLKTARQPFRAYA
jgi:hypothetical protein